MGRRRQCGLQTSSQKILGESRIELASSPGAATGTPTSCAEPRKAGLDLSADVCAAIVRRQDLDVLDIAPPVGPQILDLEVWELDAPIGKRQVLLVGPAPDLVAISAGPSIAVPTTPIRLLEEDLIVALEVLFEHDAVDVRAFLHQPLSRP